MKKQLTAKIIILSAALLWGLGFIGVQAALNSGWRPFAILAVRGLVAGIVLFVIAGFKGFAVLKQKRLWVLSILAGIVMGYGFILQSYGQDFSNVSTASILTGLYVLFTPFLAVLIKKQKLSIKVYLAGLIAFVAVVLISYDHSELSFEIGEFLLIISAIAYSLHFLIVESLADFQAAFAISGIQQLVMGISCLLLLPLSGQNLPSGGWQYVLFLALFCSGLAFVLQIYGQQYVSSSVASTLLSFESVFGVMGGILIFGEVLNWQVIVSCLLMLLAIYLLEEKT